jgi:hypothetical protein
MSDPESSAQFVFPRWTNLILPALVLMVIGGGPYAMTVVGLIGDPNTTDVGYQPVQPVPFSHAVHVGQLGMDCRYCHNTIEDAAFAAVPPTQTCMNCHTSILPDSPKLIPVRESYQTGMPVEWVKVHDLPDYAYFNHAAHLKAGVSCVECHGRVDRMEEVWQEHTLSMSWCLECHRDPAPRIRPRSEVTNLAWDGPTSDAQRQEIKQLIARLPNTRQMTDCSTCHR